MVRGLSQFRAGKKTVLLALALAAGGISASLTYRYLAQIEARAHLPSDPAPTGTVLVAKTDLAPGAVLSRENVQIREIPLAYQHSDGTTPGDWSRVDGRILEYPLKSGEPIMRSQLTGVGGAAFSSRVAPGRRAITVAVDELNSLSGLLEPGDSIDLVRQAGPPGQRYVEPLLQQATVLATGARWTDEVAGGERRHYATITLDVAPEQAAALIAARADGGLTALLRHPADRSVHIATGAVAVPAHTTRWHCGGRDVPVLSGGGMQVAVSVVPVRRCEAGPAS